MAIVQEQDYEFQGDVEVSGSLTVKTGASLTIEDGATNGYVLTSDAAGVATWQASGAGSGLLQQSTVTITSAQIKNIFSVPVSIVAAQGAGTVIYPLSYTITMAYGTAVYAGDITLRFFIGAGAVGVDSAILLQSQNYCSQRSAITNLGVGGVNFLDNAPLTLTTATSNPTLGDSDIKVIATYYVINL